MKKIVGLTMLLGVWSMPFYAWGMGFNGSSQTLNIITYQDQAEAWVATDSAKVFIAVHALSKDKDFSKLQQGVLKKLNEISNGNAWHIYNFNVNQDTSGLQRLNWELSVRLPLTIVNQLKQRLDALSHPGEQYQIINLDFQPNIEQKEKIQANLRQKIYDQVKIELKKINASFATHYFLHKIDFVYSDMKEPLARAANLQLYRSTNGNSATSIGSNVITTAKIELASSQ